MTESDIDAIIAMLPHEEMPCTEYLFEKWKNTSPLCGNKILFNCHLTVVTLTLVKLFITAGADIIVTCTPGLVSQPLIKEALEKSNLYLDVEDLLSEKYIHSFDVIIDCGAYLCNIMKPKIAFVELTHVDKSIYQDTICPVVSIDNSFIKYIETSIGTGDGFVRAIDEIYSQKGDNYQKKRYMIFGYGKVGEGISYCLKHSGIDQQQIHIVEINQTRLKLAKKNGYMCYDLFENQDYIKEILLSNINCAVTATGVSDALSEFFTFEDFKKVEYLANMGTYDEWGKNFSSHHILNNKKPLNFILEYPTKIRYLDPVFALLAATTHYVIINTPPKQFSILSPNGKLQEELSTIWFQHFSHLSVCIAQKWITEKEFILCTTS